MEWNSSINSLITKEQNEMSIVKVFRNYMEDYHTYLADKDWKVDVQTLSMGDIRHEEVKALIPADYKQELTCWIFFYDGGASNVVYLLQDKQGLKNFGICLLKDEKPVKPISFM